jgi:hypothetical protein
MDNKIQKIEDENEIELSRQRTNLEKKKISEESQKITIRKAEQIVGFVGTKVTGLGAISFGICELIKPELFSIITDKPLAYVATGLALLTGKKAIEIVNKISKSLTDEL